MRRLLPLALVAALPLSLHAQVGIVGGPAVDYGPRAEWVKGYDLQHLDIALDVDIPAESIQGKVRLDLAPLAESIKEIELDAKKLNVRAATLGGKPLVFRSEGEKVFVTLDRDYKHGEAIALEVTYDASPARGLFFVHDEPGYPEKTDQAWTQGEDEDNSLWVPLWDHPNDRTSWDLHLTVDPKLTAVSNGVLTGTSDAANGKKTFHWKMEQPNVTYLIAFAIGPWEHYADKLRDIPVEYYVNKGVGEERARRSFGETPAILEFFEEITGTKYPWPKYAQVAVSEFVVGGMENVSCTLQTDSTLHDATAELERSSRGLVAHEAAHQWFGDLATCRTWHDLWLNEGFATYYAALYTQRKEGEDAFRIEMWDNQHNFMRQDSDERLRSMVPDFYSRADQSDNHYVYIKGSSVLHMLRFVLGDAAYRRAIQLYLERHKLGLVQTRDFQIAIADATGQNLEWFFEEWVSLAGHPKFKVRFAWDDAHAQATLSVAQTQKVEGLVPVFKMPVDVEFVCNGAPQVRRIFVSKADETFNFALPSRPSRVRFDKGGHIAKDLDFEKPIEEWIEIALQDDDVIGRLEAVLALAALDDARAQETLAKVLASKDYPRVRTEAAQALAKKGGKVARDALLAALADPEARVRRAAATGLGGFANDAEVAAKLAETFEKDAAYGPRNEALRALAKAKAPGAADLAEKALSVASDKNTIAEAGLGVLVDVDEKRAAAHVVELAKFGAPLELRLAALRSVDEVAKDLTPEQRTALKDCALKAVSERSNRTRRPALEALTALADESTLPQLKALARDDKYESIRRAAQTAVDATEKGTSRRAEVERLRGEMDALKKKLDALANPSAEAK